MASPDDIIITGISGRYPECENLEELKEALLAGTDLISVDDRRYSPGTFNTPHRLGKLKHVEYFDAGYFGISPKQADIMDPRHRIMFETVFETIVDSGYNPAELRGSKTGVYIGIGMLETASRYKSLEKTDGYTMTGLNLGQVANRTSFCFDFRGPSFALDTACSSAMIAFVNAIEAMERGEIDSAIVGGVHLNFHPHEASEFTKLNMLALDGKCKVFNKVRDGYVRSEHIVTVLLQKRKAARRVYATVLGGKMNCDGYKVGGITYPSSDMQLTMMKQIFEKKNIDPLSIEYVEMHGTGTPAGDLEECSSIYQMFCKNRTKPLPVGAVKSNVGHAEVAAAMGSLSKVLIAMETGVIPANLHCEDLDKSLPGIKEGIMEVVRKNKKWPGGRVSLNSFGFGGANAHLVLESNPKVKQNYKPKSHRLVQVSGRTEESVKYYLDQLEQHREDDELLALVDEIHKSNVDGHPYRGYKVLCKDPVEEIAEIPFDEKRPIWFVYTGMGCQWPGMAKDLMQIGVFRDTLKRCANALKPYGLDLEKIVVSEDPNTFDDITNSFAAISSVEIALTEVLKSFGIVPDGFCGHSLGEVGCAYADGGLEIEQAALLGFARGYATSRAKCVPGLMAAVGLNPDETKKHLPEDVIVACRNSSSSCTISGPKDSMRKTVEELTSKGIFSRLVNTSEYAFHTKYLNEAGDILLEFVKNIIKEPRARSSKWVSTSWPEDEWDNEKSKYNSAEYHAHNFTSAVIFDQAFKHIPQNAIVIEVAPYGLLQSILKKELPKSTTSISLIKRQSKDGVRDLLSAIGKMYLGRANPDLRKFYNEVTFPVGRGTPNIGALTKWDHRVKWFTPIYDPYEFFGKHTSVNISDESDKYLEGHDIDGRILMPATGYLELVWKMLATINAKKIEELPVVFEQVKIQRATVLHKGQEVDFLVNIMIASGTFEISESGSVVCTGKITVPRDVTNQFTNVEIVAPKKNGNLPMNQSDVYKLYHLKRYLYQGAFKGIEEIDVKGTYGVLKWNGLFTPFMDAMLQVTLLSSDCHDLMLPTFIQKIVIDPRNHLRHFCEEILSVPVMYDKDLNIIKSGNIEIIGLESTAAPKRQRSHSEPNLEACTFVAYHPVLNNDVTEEVAILQAMQTVLENNEGRKTVKIAKAIEEKVGAIIKLVESSIKREPQANVEVVNVKDAANLDLLVVSQNAINQIDLKQVLSKIRDDGFVLFHGNKEHIQDFRMNTIFNNGISLLRLPSKIANYEVVKILNNDMSWLESLKRHIKQNQKKTLYLYSDEELSGIMGLMKCLLLEPYPKISFKCVWVMDSNVEAFSVESPFYSAQLKKNLTFNIFKNGTWGTYSYSPVPQMQKMQVEHACAVVQTAGDLSSFQWIERPKDYFKRNFQSELAHVFYSALNFHDVMTATGKFFEHPSKDPTSPDLGIGLEYSGVTASGRRVMGLVSESGFGLQVATDPLFTWELPPSWSLEDAATAPCVYATCYYALVVRGRMRSGESVLVHAGAGGVGLAAIAVAFSYGCEVFTTCGSSEKRDFLLKTFPKLKRENVGASRDASFESMVRKGTNGRGVDLVLNSLSADLFQASLRCLAVRGRFLEIGKVDFFAGTPINAKMFLKNCSFHGILLDDLFATDCQEKMDVRIALQEGIAKGVVKPLPRTVFEENEIEDAFRYLSTGKHKGKVLVRIRKENATTFACPTRSILAVPKMYFDQNKTYVIVGGLGGVGLELTDFLLRRNAKKIVLNSRKGITNGYQSYCLRRWSNIDGVVVRISTEDSSSSNGAETLLTFAADLGNVGGIFHSALQLDDALLENQTEEKFATTMKAKAMSLARLDEASRRLCPKLEHFVALSSIACGRGNAGQSNYGMANSIMERICEKRRREGLPALAVQWGLIGDVGAVAESSGYDRNMSVCGLVAQSINSCLDSLEKFMLQPCPIVASHLLEDETAAGSNSSVKSAAETIGHILGIKNLANIDKRQTLTQLGLDSLMVSEIKQSLYRNYGVEIETDEIRELTFEKISKISRESNETEEPKANGENGHNGYHLKTINAVLPKDMIVEIKNVENSNQNIFFLSPIEAKADLMLPLADMIRANVYCLQCTKHVDFDDLKDFGKFFLKQIKNIQNSGPYFLCGYSYGTALAFEIALHLERSGEKVEVVMLDGSPHFVRSILQSNFCNNFNSTEKAKAKILESFVKLFDDVDHEKALQLMREELTWEQQISKVSEFLSTETEYNSEEIEISFDRFYKRVAAGFYYKPTGILKGKITLIRSVINYLDFPEDYNLSMVCEQTVKVHKLEGNHQEILMGNSLVKMADIINNNLKKSS